MARRIRIRACDLKQWLFCPRQFWLYRTTGRKPDSPSLREGLNYHKEKAKEVREVKRTQGLIVMMVVIICLMLLLYFR